MIHKLTIKNFKSHSNTVLELSNINLLTGMNGMGKSSIIQSLLLLRQSNSKGLLSDGLELNGELCNIGVAHDAIYQFADTDLIEFEIQVSEVSLNWVFDAGPDFSQKTFIRSPLTNNRVLNYLSLFNINFQYISAYRNGPTSSYVKDSSAVEIFSQISRSEGRGELVAHFLNQYADRPVVPELCRGNVSNELRVQVEEWMREISPNINVHIEAHDTSFNVSYSFNRGEGNVKTNEFRAANVGFGISYVLPIVVATLHAPEGSLILIENPESHIHPTGQAVLMELIAKAASNGVQFIIETHSDHIINGLLVAVKKGNIAPEKATVHFFDRDDQVHATCCHSMAVLEGGKIRKPPRGFFDQFDKDMKTLVGF